MTRRGADAGFATVWAAGAVAVLLGLLVIGVELGAGIAARHRAEAAADLAALAAAGHAVHGTAPACARAAGIAEQMGSRIRSCRLDGWEALVEVEVDLRLTVLGPATTTGRARAGPAGPDPPAPGAATAPVRVPTTTSGPLRAPNGHSEESAVVHPQGTSFVDRRRRYPALVVMGGPIGDGGWCHGRRRCLLDRRRIGGQPARRARARSPSCGWTGASPRRDPGRPSAHRSLSVGPAPAGRPATAYRPRASVPSSAAVPPSAPAPRSTPTVAARRLVVGAPPMGSGAGHTSTLHPPVKRAHLRRRLVTTPGTTSVPLA